MTTFNERAKIRRQKLKEQNIEAQKEKRRLKALPKPLRKLETELGDHVEFMAVYDGYLGDFTGEVVPVEPVKNPFAVIHGMGLNFPPPHAFNDVQKAEYEHHIEIAFNRMGFYFDGAAPFEGKPSLNYKQLYYFIENPPEANFGKATTLKTDDISITIERFEHDQFY